MIRSLWQDNINVEIEEPLDNNIETDILIVGGGISGISTAFYLKDSNFKVTLVDRDRVGFGVSSLSTAKLTFMQDLIYYDLSKKFNMEISTKYLKSQKEAIELVKNNINKYDIDCNFEEVPSYVFTNDKNKIKNFKKEQSFYDEVGIQYEVLNELPIKFPVRYALKVNSTAVFHPVKYILNLKKICINSGIKIYEKTIVNKLIKHDKFYIAYANNCEIKAKKIILCCHYPFMIIPGLIPFRTHIEKSYIAVGSCKVNNHFSAISNNYPAQSIRFHQDKKTYILYAGESHKLSNHLNHETRYLNLINEMKEYLSDDVKYVWATHDVITNDSLPFIGILNKKDPNLLIATGFNKWGMTNGSLSGKILSDIVLKIKNEYIDLFKPDRNINKEKVKNFIIDTLNSVKIYTYSKLKKNYKFYKNNVFVITKEGNNCGVYIDENKRRHTVKVKCPHMGCGLIFNNFEHTWDCLCHGSRYDIDGNLLQGPSVKNIL